MSKATRLALAGVGVGMALPAVGGVLFSPTAGAQEVDQPQTPNLEAIGQTADALAGTLDNLAQDGGGQPAPEMPEPVTQAGDVVPSNLLRKDTIDEISAMVADQDTEHDAVSAALDAAPGPAPLREGQTAAALMDTDNPEVIGQFVGTATDPTADQQARLNDDINHLVDNVTSGQALRDLETAYNDMFTSPEYLAWANNTDNPFAPREGEGVERAAAGIDALVDSLSRRPVETINQIIGEAGGPLRVLTDPQGAATDVLTKIAGRQFVDDLHAWFTTELLPDLRDSIAEAAPLLAIPLASGGLGALLGGLGGTLATLPITLGAPLLGSSAGSALGLLALATMTFGTWLASEVPVAIAGIALGAVAGVSVGILLWGLSGFNPVMGVAAIGGGLLAAAFVTTMIIGGYTLLTAALPMLAFVVLAPLFLLGGGGLGAGLGLAIGTALAALVIPATTILFGLGGAAMTAGPALALFAIVAFTKFSDRAADWGNGPLGRVLDALNQGWESSATRHMFDGALRSWDNSDTGSTIGDINALLGQLFSGSSNVDGKAIRDLLVSGATLGGLAGLLASVLAGATTGTATGLATFIPNLIIFGAPWLALVGLSMLTAVGTAIIPPIAISVAAWIIGSLAVSSPLWVPLTLAATVATLVAFIAVNPAVLVATGGASGVVAGIAGALGAGLAAIDVVVILGALAIGAMVIGLPVFALTAGLFTFGALATQIPALLSLGVPILVAAGVSMLEGTAVGMATTGLTAPVLGGAGAILGAIIALLSSTEVDAYDTADGTHVLDAKVVNGKVPSVNALGEKVREAVPVTAGATFGTDFTPTNAKADRTMLDVTGLVNQPMPV